MRMLRLHQLGEVVLVNPAQIQTVHEAVRTIEVSMDDEVVDCEEERFGSYIYFSGEEEDALHVDESVEDIDRLIALS